jgi:hypothetical protein
MVQPSGWIEILWDATALARRAAEWITAMAVGELLWLVDRAAAGSA